MGEQSKVPGCGLSSTSPINFVQTDEIHKLICTHLKSRKGRKFFFQNPGRSTVGSFWVKECDLFIFDSLAPSTALDIQ